VFPHFPDFPRVFLGFSQISPAFSLAFPMALAFAFPVPQYLEEFLGSSPPVARGLAVGIPILGGLC
jgi:hypothetical protein